MNVDTRVPGHVPPELIRDFSLFSGPEMERTPAGNPQAALSFVHRDFPPIFYAPMNAVDGRGTWVVATAEDQRAVLQNTEIFSSDRQLFEKAMGEPLPMVPLEIDPPHHTAFRALLNPLLSPRRVQDMEVGARERAVRLIEDFKDRGYCEVMDEFAFPFAVGVFLQFLGVSDDRRDEFLGWANDQFHGDFEARKRAMRTVVNFVQSLIDLRRLEPKDDFVGFLLQAKVEGRSLTDREILGVAVLLFLAGLDTVAAALGFSFYHLARVPEDQRRLREDPELIKSAVEEFFRAYPTIQPVRQVVKDHDYKGVPFRAGDLVSCPTQLSNRDPAEFADPDTVDIARENNRHSAFAFGPHRCLGSHLARRELIIGLEEFFARIPTFRLKEGSVPVTYGGYVFGVENLVLAWN
ncbi:cytochrome P450 [Sandaracinobacter sp. RS1-74]|uniref:cytochrome P450 n=1 Tax=Sandaracinobacteroides sayramensis TaxID=2913411 RepID=UPI001EDA0CDE|nr:cytochrome P450 [Sandaracinobacteroides sayramensis]MCG2841119.1 cytochrome P450 [Sandaracinobacteroides sayramensis]